MIKELINSAHMEALLLPFLLGGVYLAVKGLFARASLALSLAASIKFWPALLLPLVWWPLFKRPFILCFSVLLSLLIGGVIIWPFLQSGLNDSSGLVAYGVKWKTNSAFFPSFETAILFITSFFSLTTSTGALIARGIVAALLVGLVFWVTLRQPFQQLGEDRSRLLSFVFICVSFFLVSPAQFPWYFVWITPFLVFYPLWGFVWLVPLMAFYYLGFYFNTIEGWREYKIFLSFLIWVPVWGLLGIELLKNRRRGLAAK